MKKLLVSTLLITLSPFISEAGVFTGLGFLPGGDSSSGAWDISANGTTVIGRGQISGSSRMFRWTAESGMIDLGQGTARGVSDDGSVIVGIGISALGGSAAFRWTSDTGIVELGSGQALGVSADGS